MSYTPTNWQSGDIVTSEKLNKLEQGVASGESSALIVNLSSDGPMSRKVGDKTYGEIAEALQSGRLVLLSWISYNKNADNIDYNYIEPITYFYSYMEDNVTKYNINSSILSGAYFADGTADEYPTELPD